MNYRNGVRAVMSLLVPVSLLAAAAPGQDRVPTIQSLTEPGERLEIRSFSRETGLPTFASSPGRGVLLAVPQGASAETRAMAFVDDYGAAFGLSSSSQMRLLREPRTDDLGVDHVRMQQAHDGVPILGAELIVHMCWMWAAAYSTSRSR